MSVSARPLRDCIYRELVYIARCSSTNAMSFSSVSMHRPAIDAGDANFNPLVFDPPLIYDQRHGHGFPRVVNGRVDIGAFESPHP